MSTEQIVNRVSQSPHYEAERQKLNQDEAPTVDQQPVYDVLTEKTKTREDFNIELSKLNKVGPAPVFEVPQIDSVVAAIALEVGGTIPQSLDWSMFPTAVAAGHVSSTEGVPLDEFPKELDIDYSQPEKNLAIENKIVDLIKKSFPQTAEQQRAGQVGSIEELPDDNIGNVISFEENWRDTLRTDGEGNVLLNDPRLDEFKKQVIAAFRHLGLDVRKHFGV